MTCAAVAVYKYAAVSGLLSCLLPLPPWKCTSAWFCRYVHGSRRSLFSSRVCCTLAVQRLIIHSSSQRTLPPPAQHLSHPIHHVSQRGRPNLTSFFFFSFTCPPVASFNFVLFRFVWLRCRPRSSHIRRRSCPTAGTRLATSR